VDTLYASSFSSQPAAPTTSAAADFHTRNGFKAIPSDIELLPALLRYGRILDNAALVLYFWLAKYFTFTAAGRVFKTCEGHKIYLRQGEAFITQTELSAACGRSRGYAWHKLRALEKCGAIKCEKVVPKGKGRKRAIGTIVCDLLGVVPSLDVSSFDQPVERFLAPVEASENSHLAQAEAPMSINLLGVQNLVPSEQDSKPTHHPSDEPSIAPNPSPNNVSASNEPAAALAPPLIPTPPTVEEEVKPVQSTPSSPRKKRNHYSPEKRQAARQKQKRQAAQNRRQHPQANAKSPKAKTLPPSVQRLREGWEATGLHLSSRTIQGYFRGDVIHACLKAIEEAGHTQPLIRAMQAYYAKLIQTKKFPEYCQAFSTFFLEETYREYLALTSPPSEPLPVQNLRAALLNHFGEQHRSMIQTGLRILRVSEDGISVRVQGELRDALLSARWRFVLTSLPVYVFWNDDEIEHALAVQQFIDQNSETLRPNF
jgi:hypothetical protein